MKTRDIILIVLFILLFVVFYRRKKRAPLPIVKPPTNNFKVIAGIEDEEFRIKPYLNPPVIDPYELAPLLLVSAETDLQGTQIQLKFSKNVSYPEWDDFGIKLIFAVSGAGYTEVEPKAIDVTINGSVILLSLVDIYAADEFTVTIKENLIRAFDGPFLAAINDYPVNNISTVYP